jgi:hypothetical protein
MAIGKASDFKIYDEQFFGGMTEVLMQNANAFNEASLNAIQLVPQILKGNYEKESFFTEISGLVSRRDVTSVAAATDIAMAQAEHASVKLSRKIGPVAQTLDAFHKISMDPQEMSFILGQQFGKGVTLDYLNETVKALVAALGGQSAVTFDYSGTGTLTHGVLAQGLSKFGDNASNIIAWVMHSKPFFDLIGQSITDKITNVADVVIHTGVPAALGRPVIVSDCADLKVSGTPDKYYTLGLVQGGAVVKESEERNIVSFLVTGLENLVLRVQGEYAYNLGLKGFTWDVTNGGVNPDDTTLATASNWDMVATEAKQLAGIRIRTQ